MEVFLFKKADGSSRVARGYKAAPPKAGTKMFSSASSKVSKLPPRVDLRKSMTKVEDQGALGSCTANAVAGAYEYLVKMHKDIDNYDVSRLFIYYNARDIDGSVDEDEGCYIASAIKSLSEYGACSEETWPYEVDQFAEEPPEEAYDEAAGFIVEDVVAVPVDLNAWKQALAEGNPIIFGLKLFSTFDSHKQPGLVPAPSKKEASREAHGGHAMLCVGYSDTDRVFIVRNSWGEKWGDKGYCYIPYDYMMNPGYNFGDSWIIKQLTNFEIDESTWGDDTSITGDYDSELAEMSEEDYEEMLDAMGDYPLEFRIGLILINAANADGEISEEEYDEISTYMQDTLEKLGVDMSAKKILKNISKEMEDEDLLEESISLLGEYLSNGLLAKILNDIRDIIGVDDLSEEEEEFLGHLTQEWQIEDSDEEEDEDDEDSDEEEDEDDEDSDEEEDEDDEDSDEEEDEDDEEDSPKKKR